MQYFHMSPDQTDVFIVFKFESCDNCGQDCLAPNKRFSTSPASELRSSGMKPWPYPLPPQQFYSDTLGHGCCRRCDPWSPQ